MVVPIYDDNPFTQPIKPIVTWCLIAANLGVYFFEAAASEAGLDRVLEIFSLIPAVFIGDIDARGWVPASATLVTYQFFHADLGHVLIFYLLCGAVGGLVFVANDPHSKIELIGASGAIAGVVIAYVMLRPCAKITVLLGIIPLRIGAYWVVGLFVILQLWHLGSASKSEVAYWCHFGGMLAGAVLFPLMKPTGVKLFQCLQPVPDTVVQIGPSRVARVSRPDSLR